MINSGKKKILEKANDFLKKGLFTEGNFFLKKNKSKFFFLLNSNLLKQEFFFFTGAFNLYLGNYKKAIIFLKKSLLSPNLSKSEILYYLIKTYLKLENISKVKLYFKKIIERTFNPFFIILSYYECIKNKINLNVSMENIEDFITFTPNDFFDKLSLSLFYILKNNDNQAFMLLEPLTTTCNCIFFYNKVYLKMLFNIKKYSKIIKYFNDNTEYLANMDFLFIYSCSLYKERLFNECIQVLLELSKFEKINRSTINLGKVFFLKKNYLKSIKFYKDALKKSKNYRDEILFYLSNAYQKIGLFNDSIKCINKIDKDSIFFKKALFNMSLIYYDIQELVKAKELFKMLDENNINNSKFLKWKEKICNTKINKKYNILKIVNFIPWIIIFFSIFVFILFYIIKNIP